MIERLSRKDAVKLLRDTNRPDIAKLTAEAEKIRGRLDALGVAYGTDDAMSVTAFRKASQTLAARLAVVESQMTHHTRASVLDGLVGAGDIAERWERFDLDRQRAIIAAVCTVTVHKGTAGGNSRNGRRALVPGSVTVEFVA